jgi:membrane protein
VSALLFTLAKIGFVAFVSKSSFNVIYGTLATIPIFLFWLYLVWSVVLLGASLAAALTTFVEQRNVWHWPWEWEFLLAFRLAGHLWEAQCAGGSLDQEELTQAEPGVTGSMLNRILEQFMTIGLVAIDKEDKWLLARDLDDVSLMDVYLSGHFHLPLGAAPDIPTACKWDRAFLEVIQADKLNLEQSLKSLYVSPDLPARAHG